MSQNKQFTISEFSRLTGIKRENLRFYDQIGLLCPDMRGANNYRYYSRHQLSAAYLVSNLRGMGVGIDDIKKYTVNQTPENTLELFARQDMYIKEKIKKLQETSLIMHMHSNMIRETLEHEKKIPFLQEKKKESIFVCPRILPDMDEDEAGIVSYKYAEKKGVNLGLPQGYLIQKERLTNTSSFQIDQYYFKTHNNGNASKPKGMYAVVYDMMNPLDLNELYCRLLDFIKEQGLSAAGAAYEEYPFGNVSDKDNNEYCVSIEIPVI